MVGVSLDAHASRRHTEITLRPVKYGDSFCSMNEAEEEDMVRAFATQKIPHKHAPEHAEPSSS